MGAFNDSVVKEKAIEGMDLGLLRGRNCGGGDSLEVAWHANSIKKRQDEGVDSSTAGDGTRNLRNVWEITTQPYKEAHFATFPEKIPERCILASCPQDGMVLEPFAGSGTTLAVAKRLGRKSIGIELSEQYCQLAVKRIQAVTLPLMAANLDGKG